ncbi:MAG TPA: glycosyltransferase family 4 protein [Gemmatimonadaceae bacterium]|nr:glycosyltransferase family 4 protein [Gemmatimonadaceae bacterium]
MVFVTHSYPRFIGDAAGSFLLTLAQALTARDIHVEVVAPASKDLAPYEALGGVPVHRFRYAPRAWETLAYTGTMAESVTGTVSGKVALLGYLLAQANATRKLVRRLAAPIVHAHWWFPGALSAGMLVRRPTRIIVTLHGSDVRLAARTAWAPGLFREVVRQVSAVTAVSGWLAQQARAMAPKAEPIVAPMPVDTTMFAPPTLDVRRQGEVLFVGRLNAQKGLHLLLAALQSVRHLDRLHVVGEGPDGAALRRQADSLGLADRITWHGALARESLVALYQRATAVAIPSLDEGLGLVAVEAQLCETPVVAFASGGLPDVVHDGATGVLAPAGDVRALAAGLDKILGSSELAITLGRNGRRRALETFSPDAAAARYVDVYRRVLNRAA